ncbi:MAG: glycosyltransferase family 4 protein [Chitinophagales bacterium]
MAFIYLTKLRSDTPADANQTLNMANAFAANAEITYFSHWMSSKETKKVFDFYALNRQFHLVRLPITLITSSLLLEKITRGLYCLFILIYIRLFKYDIVYTRDFSFVYFLSMLPAFLRPKQQIVFEPHNMLHQVSTKISLEQERQGMDVADIYVPTTEGAKEDLLNVFGVDSKRLLVQPNAVNLKNFLNVERDEEWFYSRYPLLKNSKIIVYTGTFIEWKGVEVLVQATKFLALGNAKVLLIGGIGVYKEKIEKLVKAEGFEGKVVVEGFLSQGDLVKALTMADIAVIPNNRMPEGIKYTSPLKTYEYMAMGLPIVASDLYAIRQLLKENENCVFFEAESVSDLADKLNLLLKNEDLQRSISENNVELAKHYSWEQRGENILEFIESSSKLKAKWRSSL